MRASPIPASTQRNSSGPVLCHVLDSLGRGGTQRCLVYLVRGLAARGYTQIVVALNDDTDPEILSKLSENARVVVIGKPALILGWGIVRLGWLLQQHRVDLVQTYLRYGDTFGRLVARVMRIPVIFSSIRARNLDKPRWQFRLDRFTVRWAVKVIFNSRNVIAFSERHEGVPSNKVLYIPNGVALDQRLPPDRVGRRASIGQSHDCILILSVGRLAPQKGHDDLLAAFAAIVPRHPRAHLAILGEGSERIRLEKFIQRHGLESRVTLLGARDDVTEWLAVADLFVLASHYEGMPNALMEAMAEGLPVVATEADGNSELITHRQSGLLVPIAQIDRLIEAMDESLLNPVWAKTLGNAAAAVMKEQYSVEKMVDGYDSVYRQALAVPTQLS